MIDSDDGVKGLLRATGIVQALVEIMRGRGDEGYMRGIADNVDIEGSETLLPTQLRVECEYNAQRNLPVHTLRALKTLS